MKAVMATPKWPWESRAMMDQVMGTVVSENPNHA
jgi:hypothetical protein